MRWLKTLYLYLTKVNCDGPGVFEVHTEDGATKGQGEFTLVERGVIVSPSVTMRQIRLNRSILVVRLLGMHLNARVSFHLHRPIALEETCGLRVGTCYLRFQTGCRLLM